MRIEINSIAQEGLRIVPFFKKNDEIIIPNSGKVGSDSVVSLLQNIDKDGHVFLTVNDDMYAFLNLGSKPDFSSILKTVRKFFKANAKRIGKECNVLLDFMPDISLPISWLEAIANGIRWSDYRIKDDNKDKVRPEKVNLVLKENSENRAAIERGSTIAECQIKACKYVNAPANFKTPEYLANETLKAQSLSNFSVKVLDKSEIEKEGLWALEAVGRASVHEPRFIIIEYTPQVYKHTIGLVGKGITFDTGGISIKPSNNLHFMKCDMGGAAAVLCGIEAIARLQLSIRAIAIVPCAENAVSGNAFRPGDIISSYSGKSIEIIDTDAEGRLILADGLAYINKHYSPDTLIDLATLTGSSVATLGYEAAALFSNNDELVNLIRSTGHEYGEKVWQLPLWDDYKGDLDSDVADVRNFSGKPIAGAITAAKFLEYFTEKHPRWAHLDIAGVAFNDTEFGKMKNATGYGVRLLVELAQRLSA